MQNPIKAIYQWQEEAGNLGNGYDDFLESSFQIEEALEGFSALAELADQLNMKEPENCSPKNISRAIVSMANYNDEIPDVDRFDKAIDAIVFAIGSMGKLGLTPQQIQRGLLAVNRANMQKLGMSRDAEGKLLKPDDFVGPEPELQKILDERGRDE